jgi:hypothetical protein
MGELAHLTESHDNTYAGFGKNVVRLSNAYGSTVCIIGEHDQVWFPRAITFDELQAVAHILDKKKMRKALDHHNFEKAQHYADRKFDPPAPPPPPAVKVVEPPPPKLPKRDKSADEEEERRLDELIAQQRKTMPGKSAEEDD